MRALLLLLLSCSLSHAGPTIRGQRSLEPALETAMADAERVLFIVDATPYTKAELEEIGIALQEIERTGSFRIAVLGDAPSTAKRSAGALTPLLPRLLDEPRRHGNTFRALHKTLANYTEPGAVVYLADWHFEDDQRPEGLLAKLRARRQTFSVVGSEAAFGRGWNDGFSWTGQPEFEDRIGKNPWRAGKAPWHGGETAYNHLPHRFGGTGWQTEFPLRMEGGEDLLQRLREGKLKKPSMTRFPLPSAFGPYALTRICHETGGRYVLWSWNRAGRGNIEYDYARCELFAPDLRSRKAIRADIAKRPLARALNAAWEELAGSRSGLVLISPALEPTKRSEPILLSWPGKASHDDFLRAAEKALRVYDRTLKILDRPIRKAGQPKDAIDRRYLADAHLLQFIVRAQRFSLGAAFELAKTVKEDAWQGERFPALQPIPADPRSEIMKQRAEHLERYRGTPFGEQVRRNRVDRYKLVTREMPNRPAKGNLGNTPAFSERTPRDPTPPAGGSSGGSGPSSGG